MNQRTLEALRNLAERPGTEAEGKLAREILARFDGGAITDAPADEQDAWATFRDYLRRDASIDDLIDVLRRQGRTQTYKPPELWVSCECGGDSRPWNTKCPHLDRQEAIRVDAKKYFPKGTRVYYNKWAYPRNCAGVSTGHQSEWGWLRVKFDHLKSARDIPIYTAAGWHLTTDPVADSERLAVLREGMEQMEETSKLAEDWRQRQSNAQATR